MTLRLFRASGACQCQSRQPVPRPTAVLRPTAHYGWAPCGNVASPAPRPASHRRQRRADRRQRMLVSATAAASPVDDLEVVKETLDSCKRKLTITVQAPLVKKCFHKAVENLRKIVGDMPGFRRETIPLSIIIGETGGQRNFKLTCIEEILLTAMPAAVENTVKQDKNAVVPGSEKVTSDVRALEAAFDPAKPLTFTVEYDVVPPLTWKRGYKDLEVTIKDTGDFQTDAKAADGLLRQILKEKGYQSVVADRGLQMGDTAIIDLKFSAKGSDLPLPGGLSDKKARIDSDEDPLNLSQHLIGAKAGDTRTFTVTLPSDYPIELWQGMECDVKATLKELFSWNLPQFDDEFVKKHFSGRFETAEELKKSLLASTAMERVQALDMALGEAVQQAIVESVEIAELPESLVMEMAATQYRATLIDMIEKGVASREEVEKLTTEELMMEYYEKKKKDLEALCLFNMAADEIWDKEGLTLDQKDVDEEVKVRSQAYEAQKMDYDPAGLREQIVDTFKHVKVVEWLKDNVKRNVLPYTHKN